LRCSYQQGLETRAAKSSDGMSHVGVEGTWTILIEGTAFALKSGSIVVVPNWSEGRFFADSSPVLFSFSDRAAQRSWACGATL
jgi:gentisate 1,2-dioxygenase